MGIKEKIEKWVKETVGFESVVLVHPKEIEKGDFALIINGPEAEKDFEKLAANKIPEVEKVEFVAPRFINIFLSKQFFADSIREINNQGESFGSSSLLKEGKIIVEYTNTNVLKPLHIGHLMGNVIGQAVSNILETTGAEIKRNTYQGDVGLHIAKAVWGIQKKGGITDGALREKVDYVGEAYTLGANAYEDDEGSQEEIKILNKKIFEKSDEEINKIYEWGRKVSLDHFEELYKKLNTKFDFYFFESEVSEDAVKIVREFLAKGVFEESEGAIIFRGENYDKKLHTRVFLTKEGLPLYEAKDVAHAIRKYSTYKADKSIIVTANEQDSYFKVMLKALEQINPDIADKTLHLSHGILKLSTGKMSSRKGNVITGENLISDVEELVEERLKDREYSEEEKKEIAEVVAIGAIKYSILRQAIGGDIIFDFEKSISFEGDSGPYLQYTAVRAKSVLEKARSSKKTSGILASLVNVFSKSEIKRPENFQIIEVEKLLYRFPQVVERAAKEYAPHHLVTYLTELASSFNSFYGNEKIIDEGDSSSAYKIAITRAVYNTLKNGLELLAIKVPKKM